MKEFFQSRIFKVIAVLLALLLAFFLRAVYTGGLSPLIGDLGGIIAAPIGEFFSGIGSDLSDFFEPLFHGRALQEDNEELRARLDALTERQVDYDKLKNENELYREFIKISDSNTDYSLLPATVIARVADDPAGSFIINVGSADGLKVGMPVITDTGLAGVVARVGRSYCRVSTLLDPSVDIGVLDSATQDTGVLSGDLSLAGDLSRMRYISKESAITAGDILITSGYGELIPQGLVVGTVQAVAQDDTGLTLTAEISLAASPGSARRVFIITDYSKKAEQPAIPAAKTPAQ